MSNEVHYGPVLRDTALRLGTKLYEKDFESTEFPEEVTCECCLLHLNRPILVEGKR